MPEQRADKQAGRCVNKVDISSKRKTVIHVARMDKHNPKALHAHVNEIRVVRVNIGPLFK